MRINGNWLLAMARFDVLSHSSSYLDDFGVGNQTKNGLVRTPGQQVRGA